MTWYKMLKAGRCIHCGGPTQGKKSKLGETKGEPICDKCFEEIEIPKLRKFWRGFR